MTNQEFIDTIIVCKSIIASNDILDNLRNSKLNLRDIYNKIKKHTDSDTILLSDALYMMYFLNEGLKTRSLIDTYFRMLDTYLKYREGEFKSGRELLLFDYSHKYLQLSNDLKAFKVLQVDKKVNINLNSGKMEVARVVGTNRMKLRLNGDTTMDIGGILIKDNQELFYMVKSKDDELNLIYKILEYDYDLAIIPRLTFLSDDTLKNIEVEQFSNSKYLEYLLLVDGTYKLTVNIDEYLTVYNSDIKLSKIIKILNNHIMDSGIWIKFLSILVNQVKTEDDKNKLLTKLDKTFRRLDMTLNAEWEMSIKRMSHKLKQVNSLDEMLKVL